MSNSVAGTVCRYILEKKREDIRWKIVFACVTLLLFDGIYRINNFCALVNSGIAPWLLPHMLSAMPLQFTLILGFLLISCNLPFLDADSIFVLSRSGYKNFGKGVLKSIRQISLLYLLFILLLSVAFVFPSLQFESGWGKVLNTFANTPSVTTGYLRVFSISNRIVSNYSPVEAMLLSMLLEYLCLNFLALVMLVINLALRGHMGIYFALSIAALDFFVYNDLGDKAIYFSPVSLTRLSVIDPTHTSYYPSPAYAIVFLLICCSALYTISIRLFTKRNIKM